MQELARQGIEFVSFGIELIAVAIILIGLLANLVRLIRHVVWHQPDHGAVLTIRTGLGHSLSLGLEFLLAADILGTAINPSWDAIGKLAAIAAIRTGLNYFLHRELAAEKQG